MLLEDEILDIIEKLNKQATMVLLLEQNANRALHITDRGYVLETGKFILDEEVIELLENDKVREVYLV